MTIVRRSDDGVQTLGEGIITDMNFNTLLTFKTLELPWKGNKQSISCIPPGDYNLVKRYSEKFKWHLHIMDVTGRKWILIHPGNFYTQIQGCILPGSRFQDINDDGRKDVVNSGTAMKKIMDTLPNRAYLKIIDQT